MKKLIASIISITLVVIAMFSLTACGGEKETTTLKTPGKILSVGGAIAETENYLYFVNGVGDSLENNTWGKPTKGALVVVDKSTIGTDSVKTEIVIPKLMVASDYNAGVYLFEDAEKNAYIYYATPCTEKNSSGNVASNYLTFFRSKVDGTGTEEFFTVKGLNTEYRIAKGADGSVYIVYFDEDASELISYNTANKTKIVVAKIDDKNNEVVTLTDKETTDKETTSLSLSKYALLDNGSSAQVIYTMTAYAENYYEEKANDEGDAYVRATESYNVLCSYTVGQEKDESGIYGEIIKSGHEEDKTYDISLVEDGYLFYTETDIGGSATTYAIDLSDISKEEEIKNSKYIADNIVIESLNEVYYIDTDKLVVYKTTLTGNDTTEKKTVINGDKASTLFFLHEDYMYYNAKSGKLARIKLESGAEEEIVSNDIISSTWYDPEIIEINGKEYIFYLDSSTEGASYLKYVSIDNDAELDFGEDEEEGTDDDFYTLQGHAFLGLMTDRDAANKAIAAIEAIPTTDIEYEVDENNKLTFASLEEAKAEYEKLSEASKEHVSDKLKTKLKNVETAQILAAYYYELRDYKNYTKMSEGEKQDFKQSYEEAKAYRQELIKAKDSVYTTIRDYLTDDLNLNWQEARKIFEETDK